MGLFDKFEEDKAEAEAKAVEAEAEAEAVEEVQPEPLTLDASVKANTPLDDLKNLRAKRK